VQLVQVHVVRLEAPQAALNGCKDGGAVQAGGLPGGVPRGDPVAHNPGRLRVAHHLTTQPREESKIRQPRSASRLVGNADLPEEYFGSEQRTSHQTVHGRQITSRYFSPSWAGVSRAFPDFSETTREFDKA
jgi:hypothetical protein